jgi:hypothetical protein
VHERAAAGELAGEGREATTDEAEKMKKNQKENVSPVSTDDWSPRGRVDNSFNLSDGILSSQRFAPVLNTVCLYVYCLFPVLISEFCV